LILKFCQEKKCKLIFASSNNVFPYSKLCKNKTSFHKNDYYGASKIFAEQLLENVSNVNFISLRIGDVFGIDQKHGNFFKNLQSYISKKESISLYGEGLKVRNYIYIKDLVNVLKFLIENSFTENKYYNIAYETPVNISQIIRYIAKECKLEINNVDYDIVKELTDFRTLEYSKIDSFKYEFNMWTALDDYIKKARGIEK